MYVKSQQVFVAFAHPRKALGLVRENILPKKKEKLSLSCVTRVESVLILLCTTTKSEEISCMYKLSRNQ
jgi:hypothetical protein